MRCVLLVFALGVLGAPWGRVANAQEAERPLVFVLDASRSMANRGRMTAAISAAQLGLALSPRESDITAMVFARNACFLGRNQPLEMRQALQARLEDPTAVTNLEGCRIRRNDTAYLAALRDLESLGTTTGFDAVFLTDGAPKDDAGDIRQKALALSQRGVRFFTIGLGPDVEQEGEDILGYMAQISGGTYRRAPKTADVVDVYTRILEEIAGLYRLSVREGQAVTLPAGASRLIFLLLRDDPGSPSRAKILHDDKEIPSNRRFPPLDAPPGRFVPKSFDVLDVDAPPAGDYAIVGLEPGIRQAYAFANLPFEMEVRQRAPAEEQYEGEDIPFGVEIAAPQDSAWKMLRDAPATVTAVLSRGGREDSQFTLEEAALAGPAHLRRFAATRSLTRLGTEPEDWSVHFFVKVPIGDVIWQRELRRDFRLLGALPFTVRILDGEPGAQYSSGETIPFGVEIVASNPDAWSVLQGATLPIAVSLLRDGVSQDDAMVMPAESHRDPSRFAITYEGSRVLAAAGKDAERWTAVFDTTLGKRRSRFDKVLQEDFVLLPRAAAKPPEVEPSALRVLASSGASVVLPIQVRNPNDEDGQSRTLCLRSEEGDVRFERRVAVANGSESRSTVVWNLPERAETAPLSRHVSLAWCDEAGGGEGSLDLEACVIAPKDWPPESAPWRLEPGSGASHKPLRLPESPCGIEVHPLGSSLRFKGPGGASLEGTIRNGTVSVTVPGDAARGLYTGQFTLASREARVVELDPAIVRIEVVEPTRFLVDPSTVRWNAAKGRRQKATIRMTLERSPGPIQLQLDPQPLVRGEDGTSIGTDHLRLTWAEKSSASDLPLRGEIEPGATKELEVEVWIPSDYGRGVFRGTIDIGLYREGGEPIPLSPVTLEVTVP